MKPVFLIAGAVGVGVALALAKRGTVPASSLVSGTSDTGVSSTDPSLVDLASGYLQVAFGSGTMTNQRTSFAGINLIKHYEKLRLFPYDANPPSGDWTIGWGHKLQQGESFNGGISSAKANALFNNDLTTAELRVNRRITISLSQSQYDALVSAAFNLSNTGFSQLAARINAGEKASSAFARFVFGGGVKLAGLVTRRNDEIALWNSDTGGVA